LGGVLGSLEFGSIQDYEYLALEIWMVDSMKGEDIRASKWFKEFSDTLIENYIKLKERGKDGDLLRCQIDFAFRKRRILKPTVIFSLKGDLEDILLEVKDE